MQPFRLLSPVWGPCDGRGYIPTVFSSPALVSLRRQGARSHFNHFHRFGVFEAAKEVRSGWQLTDDVWRVIGDG